MAIRIYPVKIRTEQGEQDRVALDREDVVELMIALEMGNFNVLENWVNLRNELMSIPEKPPEGGQNVG